MRASPKNHTTSADTTAAMDRLMATLDHPLKAEIEDRCLVSLGAGDVFKKKLPAFREFARQWIRYL